MFFLRWLSLFSFLGLTTQSVAEHSGPATNPNTTPRTTEASPFYSETLSEEEMKEVGDQIKKYFVDVSPTGEVDSNPEI